MLEYYYIPLKILYLISDGSFYTYKNISNIIGKHINIHHNINLLQKFLGLEKINTSHNGFKVIEPIQLINKNKLNDNILKNNNIFIIPILDSTNQFLINNLKKLKLGDICISEYQTKGRGRNGKTWFSPIGNNLYFSIYWEINKLKSILGLSLAIAVSLAESLKKLGIKNIKIKWPNDIYLYKKKLAGILIETIKKNNTKKTSIIIGIGINLSKNNFFNSISLIETKINIDRHFILSYLIINLKDTLIEFEKTGLKSFFYRFLKLDMYLNKNVNLIFANKKISGIHRGIDSRGYLIIEKNNFFTSWNFGSLSLHLK